MTRRKTIEGICRICGKYGTLSFEHVPPRSAFNNRSIILVKKFKDIIGLDFDAIPKGETQQRGAGYYSLCPSCNNKTGHWYGNYFANWCCQAMEIMIRSNGNPTLFYLHHIFPLAILKQIICMFFSVNSEKFGLINPELVNFVLNKEKKYLSPKYRVFVYFNKEGRMRYNGIQGRMDVNRGGTTILTTEISFPPLGYIMTIDSEEIPDKRLFEISHFSKYPYNEFKIITLQLPILPTYTFYSGDYRTKEELMENRKRNSDLGIK